jgi:hypothetical protein
MRGAIKKSRQERPFGQACLFELGDEVLRTEGASGFGQSEEGRQVVWNPEEGEGDPLSLICSSVASQPLIPGQAAMRELGSGDRRRGGSTESRESRFHLDLQVQAMHTETRLPLVPSGPVPSENRSRSHCKGMEQHTHLARFCRCAPTPLALLAQRTRTTVANAGSIDHAQTTVAFSAPLVRDQHVTCGTAKGPIRLERKMDTSEATSLPGPTNCATRCGQ